MNGYLLDTHIAIFALQEPEKLSAAARDALLEGGCILSLASYWEVVIKSMKGMLAVGDLRTWWPDSLNQLIARPLPIYAPHIYALSMLPAHHKDPFDRILIAQAIAEDLTLITEDENIMRYTSAGLKVLI